jgi:YbgC/YbaW family acyl-CoA thioester hydrolase
MESVDAVGIVFYAAYWLWYEQVFEGFVAAASGSSWREVLDSGLAMPVVHTAIDYLLPLRLSDGVTVELRLVKTGRRSVEFEARFQDHEGDLVAVARAVHLVTTRRDLATAAIPSWLSAAVEPAYSNGDSESA